MTLPTSGPMSVSMINTELRRSADAAWSMNGSMERTLAAKPSGSYAFSDFYGKEHQIVKYITTSGAGPDTIKNLFTSSEWASDIHKVVIQNSGVEIGGNNHGYAITISDYASGQSGSFNGKLTYRNYGIISGRGGAANSGVGGTAFLCNLRGRNGALMRLENYGTIRGGGGGGGTGGRGGNGGGGYWDNSYWVYDGWGYRQSYLKWVWTTSNRNFIYWHTTSPAGELARGIISEGSFDGVWIYEKGVKRRDITVRSGPEGQTTKTGEEYEIRRRRWQVDRHYTSGGAGGWGGAGGRGQGYGQSNQGGSGGTAGAAGGTNAGRGGNGGTGGTGGTYGNWGATGATGAWGGAGNNGGGGAPSGGSAGGAPGFYIEGINNITLVNSGTVQGRVG